MTENIPVGRHKQAIQLFVLSFSHPSTLDEERRQPCERLKASPTITEDPLRLRFNDDCLFYFIRLEILFVSLKTSHH